MGRKSSTILGIILLGALAFTCVPAHAEGVVSQCDETHLLLALSAGGTVTFSCSGTIILTSTIVIASDTTIDGTGQNVTISGDHAVPVFGVPPGVKLNLKKLTIANGSAVAGGGGSNDGTLTVTNCTFTGNSADVGGAIANDQGATLTVTNSMFTGNSATIGAGGIQNRVGATLTVTGSTFTANEGTFSGGGIGNNATATVTNSTFSGNSAGHYGGGIANARTLTVTSSTFSGNNATLGGGGIFNFGESTLTVSNSTFSGNSSSDPGGGIATGGTATVTNSTFYGNTSSNYGGGIASGGNGATLILTNSTFSANSATFDGGGILNDNFGTLTLRNTIVADSPSGGNCGNEGSAIFIDGGGNLSWPDTTCPGINSDPRLDPAGLRNNGGPTQTIALLTGSAAIDAAVDGNCPTTDQRGVLRPQGPHCDIGAFELVPYVAQVQQPINADGSSIFSAKRGVVPVKFTLTLNGVATCSLPPATIAVTRTAGGTLGSIDESTYTMSADTGSNFRVDPSACQYIYNLAASALGTGVYRVDILINGSITAESATFALK
jgi:hypothetical protein